MAMDVNGIQVIDWLGMQALLEKNFFYFFLIIGPPLLQ